jgi:hypothetical protein
MNLIIINSINNNTYADNLYIPNIPLEKITYLLQNIIIITNRIHTPIFEKPTATINYILKTAYNRYNSHCNIPERHIKLNTTFTLEIDWYFNENNTINKEKSTITGLDLLLNSIKSTDNFDNILSHINKHNNRIEIKTINYDLKKIPLSMFNHAHRDIISAGISIYKNVVRDSSITILYDKINKTIYFNKERTPS